MSQSASKSISLSFEFMRFLDNYATSNGLNFSKAVEECVIKAIKLDEFINNLPILVENDYLDIFQVMLLGKFMNQPDMSVDDLIECGNQILSELRQNETNKQNANKSKSGKVD